MAEIKNEIEGIFDDILAYLKYARRMGCSGLFCDRSLVRKIESWDKPAAGRLDLASIESAAVACSKCKLANSRKAVIFGSGPVTAGLMIVGGFPEPADARAKKPYSGPAGELLNKIIAAMGQSREDVYITFAVKCAPASIELASSTWVVRSCSTHLEKQVKTVSPRVIIAFGEIAARALVRTKKTFAGIRGKFFEINDNILVMPTYSPEEMLKDPAKKRPAWEDLKKVMARIG